MTMSIYLSILRALIVCRFRLDAILLLLNYETIENIDTYKAYRSITEMIEIYYILPRLLMLNLFYIYTKPVVIPALT